MNADKRLSLPDKICIAVASLFGIGYIPLFSGTWACVLAVLFFVLLKNTIYFFIFTCFSVMAAYLFSTPAERLIGQKDSRKIVIDDFSGMLITFLGSPYNFISIVVGFFLFRAFDCIKIPPADTLERYRGAKGIVGDDVVAGLYANLILHLARFALKISS